MATYRKNEKITFVNPYTFVPLSEIEPERIDAEDFYKENKDSLQSGYLQCQLEVKTPLAIPDAERKSSVELENKTGAKTVSDNQHASYPFFTLNGAPAIPGCSIRGAVRSVYETVTDSCMCTAKPDTRISLRVDPGKEEAFKPGLLIKDGHDEWELFEADSFAVQFHKKEKKNKAGNMQQNYQVKRNDTAVIFQRNVVKGEAQIKGFYYGDKVSFCHKSHKVIDIADPSRKLEHEGYMFIGEKFSNQDRENSNKPIEADSTEKYNEHIFEKKENKKIDIDPEEINAAFEGLKQTLRIYRDIGINRNYDGKTHLGYPGFKRACENGVVPLWFAVIDNHLYLSLAAIGRKQFIKTYRELLGKHNACNNRQELCPACLLFGMIGDHDAEHQGMGSRVRISDAYFTGNDSKDIFMMDITLKELSAPRPSYLPFYSKKGLSFDDPKGGIRGRKFYWHHQSAKKNNTDYKTEEKTKRNATMQLVKSGTVFDFKIYFDQITQEQLDTLMAVVTLGNDTEFCHKLGHGKPLGLGSVKIKISEVAKRKYQSGSYQIDLQKDPKIAVDLSEALKAVLAYPAKMEDDVSISYPWVQKAMNCKVQSKNLSENDLASHQWFGAFRDDHGLLPEILNIIPKNGQVSLAKQGLPIYELVGSGTDNSK